jgi:hypothetical protein
MSLSSCQYMTNLDSRCRSSEPVCELKGEDTFRVNADLCAYSKSIEFTRFDTSLDCSLRDPPSQHKVFYCISLLITASPTGLAFRRALPIQSTGCFYFSALPGEATLVRSHSSRARLVQYLRPLMMIGFGKPRFRLRSHRHRVIGDVLYRRSTLGPLSHSSSMHVVTPLRAWNNSNEHGPAK